MAAGARLVLILRRGAAQNFAVAAAFEAAVTGCRFLVLTCFADLKPD
jgi:hypothetical protein